MEHNERYVLLAVPRWFVSERFYLWVIKTFGERFVTQQPWRWLLHRKLDEFTIRRTQKPDAKL